MAQKDKALRPSQSNEEALDLNSFLRQEDENANKC